MDYGWWGNAFVLAWNNRVPLGYGDSKYDGLFNDIFSYTDDCWAKLQETWLDSGPYGIPQDHAAGSASIVGGAFNVPVDDPHNWIMQGRNSVTNEVHWLLSHGCAKIHPPPPNKYTYAGNATTKWFQQWLSLTGGTGLLDSDRLVLERPTGNGTYAAWRWTGDQGLFIKQFYDITNGRQTALDIANNVNMYFMPNNILHEDLSFLDHPGLSDFVVDYATGKGVFMRGLVYVSMKEPGNPFADLIKLNASAIWRTRLVDIEANQFAYNWDGAAGQEPAELKPIGDKSQNLCYLVMQGAGQDALNAAMLIAPNDQIPGS
jgi:hypothetical protein